MPLVVDATPKGTNSNSYLTQVRASAILDARLYSSAWTNATSGDKDRAIVWATTLLDAMMDWLGTPTEPGIWNGSQQINAQALRWPRWGVLNRDKNAFLPKDLVPLDIEVATAELALALLSNDRFTAPSLLGQGIEEAAVGSIRVKVSKEMMEDLIPDNIYAMVAHLGQPIPEAQLGGSQLHKIDRT